MFLPLWYPNINDIQLGIFLKKQAEAVSIYNKITVIYICSVKYLKKKYDVKINDINDNMKEIIVYYKKTNNVLLNNIKYIFSFKKAIKNIDLHEIDCYHFAILASPEKTLIQKLILPKKTYFITEQWSGYITGHFDKLNIFKRILIKRFFQDAKAVFTVSNFLRKKLESKGIKGKFIIFPNVIRKNNVKEKNIIKNNNVNILVVADLKDEIKNISSIISTFKNALKQDKRLRLHIIGGGKDESYLKELSKELINKFVFFYGIKNNDFVIKKMLEMNFLIVNSNVETFSLVCAEALSTGIPVIATKCGGPEEIINKETGILIEKNNNNQLLEAILYLTNNLDKYEPQKLSQYSLNKYSESKIAKIFDDNLNKLITNCE